MANYVPSVFSRMLRKVILAKWGTPATLEIQWRMRDLCGNILFHAHIYTYNKECGCNIGRVSNGSGVVAVLPFMDFS